MNKKIIFEGKSRLEKISFDSNSNSFYFNFEEINLIHTSFWRFYIDNKIEQVSDDHNKKYIFDKPEINILDFLKKELQNEYLSKIEIMQNNDLILYFSSNKKIEIYITSMAFENWEITIKNQNYVCLQGGYDIAIFG